MWRIGKAGIYIYNILQHVSLSDPVFAGQSCLCILPCSTFQVSFHGVCLYPHLFACLFFLHPLCSAAELTRCHFAQSTAMVQLKGVISQNNLMMVVVLQLTSLQRDRKEKRVGMLWGGVCSIQVLWLSDSTADSRQGKISLPLLLSGGREIPASCRSSMENGISVQSSRLFALWWFTFVIVFVVYHLCVYLSGSLSVYDC